jgi:hypothetical protein
VCPRRGAAGGFKNYKLLLGLNINVNRIAALQRKRMEIAMFQPIAAGKLLKTVGQTLGTSIRL